MLIWINLNKNQGKTLKNDKVSFVKGIDSNIQISDIRLDTNISSVVKKFLNAIPIYDRRKAEVLNKQIEKWYSKHPFADNTFVSLFKTDHTMQNQFVRLYNQECERLKCGGQFIVLRADVMDENGCLFSPDKLQDKFDLPWIPTHASDVSPSAGTELAVGIVKPRNFGGIGQGTQFYFTNLALPKWFSMGMKLKH
jgi:hypothetical protein